jgi:hypothetical protein
VANLLPFDDGAQRFWPEPAMSTRYGAGNVGRTRRPGAARPQSTPLFGPLPQCVVLVDVAMCVAATECWRFWMTRQTDISLSSRAGNTAHVTVAIHCLAASAI